MAAAAIVETTEPTDEYVAYNAAADLFDYRGKEVMLAGPANTGKTRAILELVNYEAQTYPGYRCLLVRKTLTSLKASVLVTFDEKVRPDRVGAVFKGQTAKRPAQYEYPDTGAVVVIGGMDDPMKVMSSEYDRICVFEAVEIDESDWEALSIRLRNHRLPFQQLCGDCNPDAQTHWIMQRAEAGKLLMLHSRHEDNPSITAQDLATLDALTGVRRARYFLGLWVAAEGMIYEDAWDVRRNLRNRREFCTRTDLFGDCGLPRDWPRTVSIDFGFVHPLVCQWWAEDPDGRLILYRELYMSNRLIAEHCADMLHWMGYRYEGGRLRATSEKSDPLPRMLYCDPEDAEGKEQIRQHIGLRVTNANKDVQNGIQTVATRMKPAGDGKPRLLILRDSVVKRDPLLLEAKKPTCTADEIEGYVWDTRNGEARGEKPRKQEDDGCDAMRYRCAADLAPRGSFVLRGVI